MKRVLITSTDLMMMQFLLPHVKNLVENGYSVEVACSNVGNRIDEVKQRLGDVVVHCVRLKRNPFVPSNLKGLSDLKEIINSGSYDLIWTNEPVMSVMTRIAARSARKAGTKVVYMAHGFHFYNGAPIVNWLIYYPIEKVMARYADAIVTVNREDYSRAKKFNTKRVEYIHGIGIDTTRLSIASSTENFRDEIGLSPSDFVILSIGELNKNKNQKTILQALSKMNEKDAHYVLCGKGARMEALKEEAVRLGISERVHFLGYRKDVVKICSQSDLYVMPSRREGLPVASLEAMYCGLPLVTSNIRGLVDVMEDGVTGYTCNPNDAEAFAIAIDELKRNPDKRKAMGEHNKRVVMPFCIEECKREVISIIEGIISNE